MRRLIVSLISLVVVLAVLVGFFLASSKPGTDIPLEVGKAGINLIVAVLITGVLSVVLTRHAADRTRQEVRAFELAGALRELKAGYERIQVARFFLRARTTGKTFGDQIEAFTEARAHLHRVQRERFVIKSDVDDCVQHMLDYLNGVLDEYQENYSRITSEALVEERMRRQVLDGAPVDLSAVPRLLPEEFPAVAGLIDEENWRKTTFHENYSATKHRLEAWMSA